MTEQKALAPFTLSDLRGEVRCIMQQKKMFHAIELGDWEQAQQSAPCIEQGGVAQEVWLRLIEVLRETSVSQEDLQMLRMALRKAPRCVGLYHGLVRLFLQHRDIEQAIYWWGIGIKIEPHNPLLWIAGMRIALLQDDLSTAEFRYQSATRWMAEDDPLRLRAAGKLDMARACMVWGEGQHEQALFWLRRATRYDPSWAEPWEALAQYLDTMGCKERAAWYATEARRRQTDPHPN